MSFRGVIPRHAAHPQALESTTTTSSTTAAEMTENTRLLPNGTGLSGGGGRGSDLGSAAMGSGDLRLGLVLLGVVVAMLVVLSFTHNTFSARANSLLTVARDTAFSVAHLAGSKLGVEDGGGSGSPRDPVRLCLHRGIDASRAMAAVRRELRPLGWSSLSKFFRFMCHVPELPHDQRHAAAKHSSNNESSDAAVATHAHVLKLRTHSLGDRSICCSDYDVFFSREGTAWVGRPETVAVRLATLAQGNPLDDGAASTMSESSPDARHFTAALLAQSVADVDLDAALGDDGGYEHGERLAAITRTIADMVFAYAASQRLGVGGPWGGRPLAARRIHATLELKVNDAALTATEGGDKKNRSSSSDGSGTARRRRGGSVPLHTLPRANSRIAAVIARSAAAAWSTHAQPTKTADADPAEGSAASGGGQQQRPTADVSRLFASPDAFTLRVVESCVVIVDPVFRFRSLRGLLLRASPEYFLPYLETTPQIAYSMPLLDRPLTSNQLPVNGEEGQLDARGYCLLLTTSPPWVAELLPSVRFLSYCIDLFPRLLLSPASRLPKATTPSSSAAAASRTPLNVWLVDTKTDVEYVALLRSRLGLTQLTSVISNVARDVADEL
jgi:hypothetical protein